MLRLMPIGAGRNREPPGSNFFGATPSPKRHWHPHRPRQQIEILRTRNLMPPELSQMLCRPLRVMHHVTPRLQPPLQMRQRHLRRLRLPAEHRLPKKRPTNRHPIHPAHQPPLAPHLRRMPKPHPEQLLIHLQNRLRDPSRLPIRTPPHHIPKRRVPPHLKRTPLQKSLKAPRHMKLRNR